MRYVYLNTVHAHGKVFQFMCYSRNMANLYHNTNGGKIHRLSYGYFKDYGKDFDGPTFRTVGEEIKPGRVKFPVQLPEVSLEGATGFESMVPIAQAIGLKVHQSESKAGTLIIIEKV
jgi:hypothetical protein